MPILFCDTVGREGEVRVGSKGDRDIGIGSKYNIEEAKKVVSNHATAVTTACLGDMGHCNRKLFCNSYSRGVWVLENQAMKVLLSAY